MADPRPSVPASVKRQLRQEAGFGCVFCGHPFVDYHHIVPWAEDQHFRPEDMMLVCANCHRECTAEARQISDQRQAKRRPKNVVDGHVRGHLFVNSRELTVHLGSVTGIDTPTLLSIGGVEVVGARLCTEDGRVLVSAVIHDSNGEPIGWLQDNEWIIGVERVWDLELWPRRAVVRSNYRDVSFSVDTRDDVVRMLGKWYYGLQLVDFSSAELVRIGRVTIAGMTARNGGAVIAIG